MSILLFSIFVILLALEMPVAFSLIISTIITVFLASDIDTIAIVVKMLRATENFQLTAVPFFILAGALMETGGISRRIVDFSSSLIGHFRGGLANVSVLAAMFFAGISGAAAADTAAVGSLLIPAMKKKGYGSDIATSVMATAGSIGIVIPPSIPMIILGVTASVSIGGLFMGGILPGILMGLALMLINVFFCKKKHIEPEKKASLRFVIRSFFDSIIPLGTVVIIIGGIVAGIATPTEASVLAVVYAFIVGFFYYKELKIADLPRIIFETGMTTGVVLLTVAAAASFGWILTAENIPELITKWVVSFSDNKWVILIILNILFLIMGTFLDPAAIIIITVPIVWPIIQSFGIEPIYFGITLIVNMAIGQCTPPVGIALFVASGISEAKLSTIIRTYIFYIGALIIVLFLTIFFTPLSTYIPRVAGYI